MYIKNSGLQDVNIILWVFKISRNTVFCKFKKIFNFIKMIFDSLTTLSHFKV